jgi:hypothetical protein
MLAIAVLIAALIVVLIVALHLDHIVVCAVAAPRLDGCVK